MEIDDLTKEQQAAVRAFERVMARFAKLGLMMFNWSGRMCVFRVEDYNAVEANGWRYGDYDIWVDEGGMQSDGGDPD